MDSLIETIKDLEKDKTLFKPVLDVQTIDNINMMYGTSKALPMPPSIEAPPSPDRAIENGCIFLKREFEKGFIGRFDSDEFRKSLLRPAIIAKASIQTANKHNQLFDVNKLFEAEPYQKFWLTSETVNNIKKEISTQLPFINRDDVPVVISRFLEAVASHVRVMKHHKMLENEFKQKKKQLRATMMHFITCAGEARKKVFVYAIQQQLLDLDNLNETYQNEFKDVLPKKEETKEKENTTVFRSFDNTIENKILENISDNCDKLPSLYKMTPYQINEEDCMKTKRQFRKYIINLPEKLLIGMAQTSRDFQKNLHTNQVKKNDNDDNDSDDKVIQNTRNNVNIISIPFNRLKNPRKTCRAMTSSKPLTEQESHEKYWENYDPLSTRQGEKHDQPLKQLNYAVKSFVPCLPDASQVDIEMPFELEYKPPLENQPVLIGDIWTTSDLSGTGKNRQNEKGNPEEDLNEDDQNQYKYEYEEEEEEEGDDEFLRKNIENEQRHVPGKVMTIEAARRNKHVLRFLKSYEFSKSSEESESIVGKLQNIWESLGFSVHQKLDILIKYTRTIEDSQRLKEALSFWEMSLDVVNQYDKVYQAMKDFVKYEASSSPHARATCQYMWKDLEANEKNVQQAADHLLRTLNDELVIHRRSAHVIIPERRQKMAELMKPYYISYTS
ncbi:hypothetical protein TRFO_25343 [Tritrichomonas foetus]|uniref:Uncharacterized protein n=1 Tax=Tritrichomonas foetus TaxID=1144522 RepID=A0A1J4KA74_9EUKA|nr:hypothetical protein TRFO_25343 [Tritrichomonas foetus]|eukprot:OHT06596.1 hypothetical protein TRFO_25343 [Tritrichomonas foetus]